MRNQQIVFTVFTAIVLAGMISCSSEVRRTPGKIYVPDMAYSRAVETYADHSYLNDQGIRYDATPVAGTVKRGGMAQFPLTMDKPGDTANYFASRQIQNPITSLNEKQLTEAARLYNINCGICHGEKLDGNGPIYKGGEGPYPAKPATLVGDAKYESMPAGQMMYSLVYGKNLMGSYASQLSTEQRWMIIHYIKVKQGKIQAPAANIAADAVASTEK